ncbi:hypothetical protein [Methylobacterium durans]|uniref:Uncharacterized protein n=1 Tax=Methylobacterium durans TaxID=2202825 RepID=A0A2U8W301_9HYPH|nr:hypothetical protein [Methylobacterium durans]AWN40048.1 hypothetical protein DK389_05170 [Methylobacterium durans]
MIWLAVAAGGLLLIGLYAVVRMVEKAPLCDEDELERVAREVTVIKGQDEPSIPSDGGDGTSTLAQRPTR